MGALKKTRPVLDVCAIAIFIFMLAAVTAMAAADVVSNAEEAIKVVNAQVSTDLLIADAGYSAGTALGQ